jgi:hypothetical protein
VNWEKLKQNVSTWVQISPIAYQLDEYGVALPDIDDDWFVHAIVDDVVTLSRNGSGLNLILGKDHIHHFATNPGRTVGNTKYGLLQLHVQAYIQGDQVRVKPTPRPGERVPPPEVSIAEKAVHVLYPGQSGMQQRLAAQGYTLQWIVRSRVAQFVDLWGWKIVVEPDANGRLSSFCVEDRIDDLILIKKRTDLLQR